MSATQMLRAVLLVGGVSVAGLNGVIKAVLPEIPPIVAHSLEYKDGVILQDRTVTVEGDGVFWAQWEAQIVYAETGDAVPGCTGSGSWNYKAGTKTYEIPLAEWVGAASCTPEALPAGCYKPVAAWAWGPDQTSAIGKEWCKE